MTSSRALTVLTLIAMACACGTKNPPPPNLGSIQIDRMGRAAVNTVLTAPFDLAPGQDQTKDAYNADNNPATWFSTWGPAIVKNLAILDGLDRVCGNQFIARPAFGGTIPPDRYVLLTSVLADDQLFVDTSSGTCNSDSIGDNYLAVEANATGVNPNSKCGGRTPTDNTIDVTYSRLVGSAVSNGITSDVDGNPNATTFPFLGSPN